MSLSLSAADPRGPKAVTYASQADQWQPVQGFLVPSSDGQHRYFVTADHCTCPDFRTRGKDRPCAHVLAVELVSQMAADPCSDLVLERLPSGEFAWLRPEVA